MIHVVIILGLAAGCYADGGIAYRGPPPVREVFHFTGNTYFLHSDRVGWDEASAICHSNNGILAEPDDSYKAAFLAQCIADAWASLEDMWIGGQKSQNEWKWVSKSKKIATTVRQLPNTTFLYPPWVTGSVPLRTGRDCLGLDRNGHSDPYFIDLECKLPRPFICEVSAEKSPQEPRVTKSVVIYNTEFVLYHGRLSWDGAVAFCRSNGYVLASVLNSSIAEKLAKAMLKARPEFEDVWIGGAYRNGRWMWVDSSDEISENGSPSLDGNSYPPWMHEPATPMGSGKNCILFDRHLCDHPTFINIMCNRVRDFVCSRPVDEAAVIVPTYTTQVFRKKEYHIHHTPSTFEEGLIICHDEQNTRGKGKMLYIDGGILDDPFDELMFLMQVMSDYKDSLIHVWLAAQYNSDEKVYKWLYDSPNFDKSDTKNTKTLSNDPDAATGYPPWCHNEDPTPDTSCLNLDRQNYNSPLFYGLECNVTQSLICVLEAISKGTDRFTIGSDSFQSSDYPVTLESVSWHNALKICEEDTGFLITDVSEDELVKVAEELADGDYFIGARFSEAGQAEWSPSLAPMNLTDSVKVPEYNATNGKCLAIKVEEKKIGSVYSTSCDSAEAIGYICQDKCGSDIDEVADHSYRCTWRVGKGVSEGYLGKMCVKRCGPNTTLVGSKKMFCSKRGWSGHGSSKGANCLSVEDTAARVKEILDAVTGGTHKSRYLFIYDGSSDVRPEECELMRYFIGALLTNLPVRATRKRRETRVWRSKREDSEEIVQVPLISLGDQATIEIQENGICAALQNLSSLTEFESPSGRRDYNKAFYEARKTLEDSYDSFSVVVISSGPNQGEDYRDTLRALKRYAKTIISVGLGDKFSNDELAEIATMDKDKNLHFVGVLDTRVFNRVSDSLQKSDTCADKIAAMQKKAQDANMELETYREVGAIAAESSESGDEEQATSDDKTSEEGNETATEGEDKEEEKPAEEEEKPAEEEEKPAEGEEKAEEAPAESSEAESDTKSEEAAE